MDGNMIILTFSTPLAIEITDKLNIFDVDLKYKAHIEETPELSTKAYFSFDGSMFSQDANDTLHIEDFGVYRNVKILSLAACKENTNCGISESKLIYDRKNLIHLHKKYLSVINPKAYEEQKEKERVYEKKSYSR